ncbi:carbonic anhydrase family protein [Persicobacter diffluens]|uniref:Carbonic anhydrase n=1 Tax=Persicobacter diffluens TaxID=981 RepID=A0AAN4W1H0_9BACT|nr:carbonic anhydrase [Persicobacter diffluens]
MSIKSTFPWLVILGLAAIVIKDHYFGEAGHEAHATPQEAYLHEEVTGVKQSPINIKTSKICKPKPHQFQCSYKNSHEKIVNTGHTIRLDYDSGSVLEYDGQAYNLRQFHFHTPSEHLIDGITYPMEAHFVHTAADNDTTYLVVGVLFKEGNENDFLKKFINSVPDHEGEKELWTDYINADDIVKASDHFYCYDGSLTTPPFTETVKWFVKQDILDASEEQIMMINELEGNNARHIQAVNNREIEGL